jgi:hypothetical protein
MRGWVCSQRRKDEAFVFCSFMLSGVSEDGPAYVHPHVWTLQRGYGLLSIIPMHACRLCARADCAIRQKGFVKILEWPKREMLVQCTPVADM